MQRLRGRCDLTAQLCTGVCVCVCTGCVCVCQRLDGLRLYLCTSVGDSPPASANAAATELPRDTIIQRWVRCLHCFSQVPGLRGSLSLSLCVAKQLALPLPFSLKSTDKTGSGSGGVGDTGWGVSGMPGSSIQHIHPKPCITCSFSASFVSV